MRKETKYGIVELNIVNDSIIVKSDIPFKEIEKSFPIEQVKDAQIFFKKISDEIDEIIKKMETKKVSISTGLPSKLNTLYSNGLRKILLYGPTGSGKTFGIVNFLNILKEKGEIEDYLIITLFSGMEDIDLLGKFMPNKDGKIEFIPSVLTKFLEGYKDGKIAIVFDEFNRASAKALNILIPMLDGRNGKVVFDNYIAGSHIEIPQENVLFMFTANFGGSYSGTFQIDAALLNRIDIALFVDYQSELEKSIVENIVDDEEKVKKILKIVDYLRGLYKEGMLAPVSTRDIVTISNLLLKPAGNYYEIIMPVIYKLVPYDPQGYPDEDVLEDIKKGIEQIEKSE